MLPSNPLFGDPYPKLLPTIIATDSTFPYNESRTDRSNNLTEISLNVMGIDYINVRVLLMDVNNADCKTVNLQVSNR